MQQQQRVVVDIAASKPTALARILMLHGYQQNEKFFRERTGGLRKVMRKCRAELVYCQAPHVLPVLERGAKEDEAQQACKEDDEVDSAASAAAAAVGAADECDNDGEESSTVSAAVAVATMPISSREERGWWLSNKDAAILGAERCQPMLEASLDYINQVCREQGPFDGIFGFSQGASLTAILCSIAARNQTASSPTVYEHVNFRFAVLVAGFKSNRINSDVYFDRECPIALPTLHIIGRNDQVIAKEMGLHLTEFFASPRVHVHDGGHHIPVSGDAKKIYTDFLTQVIDKK